VIKLTKTNAKVSPIVMLVTKQILKFYRLAIIKKFTEVQNQLVDSSSCRKSMDAWSAVFWLLIFLILVLTDRYVAV